MLSILIQLLTHLKTCYTLKKEMRNQLKKKLIKHLYNPTPHCNHCKDKAPIVSMKSRLVNGQLCGCQLFCLFDFGSTGYLFNKWLMPLGTKTNTTTNKILQTTTQGTHICNKFVFIDDIQLPKFNNSRYIKGSMAFVFDSHNCPYNVMLGRNFLQTIGIKMDF